jgi:hypothetical protein
MERRTTVRVGVDIRPHHQQKLEDFDSPVLRGINECLVDDLP